MKSIIALVIFIAAPFAAIACSSTFRYIDGKKVTCMTCCQPDGRCSTNCFSE